MKIKPKFFSVRMDTKLHARIKQAAARERRSSCNWATGILEQAVRESEVREKVERS